MLLLFGIARTVLRMRRKRKGTDAAALGTAEGEGPEGAEEAQDAGADAAEPPAGDRAGEATGAESPEQVDAPPSPEGDKR